MRKVRVINDVHLYGADPCMTKQEFLEALYSSPYPVVLNGDNFDVANCKYKLLPELYQLIALVKTWVSANGHVFIRGNHCTNHIFADDSAVINTTFFTHGDLWMWDIERAMEFRAQKAGAGWFKRNMISRPLSALRHLVAVRPNERLIANITQHSKNNPHITHYVFGHSHPSTPVRFSVRGCECVILPRGVNDIELV